MATHPGGANTISSGDIIDEEVRAPDIDNGAVRTFELRDDNVLGLDIADSTIASVDIQNNQVRSADVANENLTGTDVADSSITDTDTSGLVPYGDVLWAVVNSDGSLARASNATTTSTREVVGSGDYEVNFGNGGLDQCASMAQISDRGTGFEELPGQAASAKGELFARSVDVRTFDSAGTSADRAFTVFVLCPEGEGGA